MLEQIAFSPQEYEIVNMPRLLRAYPGRTKAQTVLKDFPVKQQQKMNTRHPGKISGVQGLRVYGDLRWKFQGSLRPCPKHLRKVLLYHSLKLSSLPSFLPTEALLACSSYSEGHTILLGS